MQNGKEKSQKEKPPSRINYQNILILACFSLILTGIIGFGSPFWTKEYRVGDIVHSNIKAPRDTLIPQSGVTVKKGEVIVREGEPITEGHLEKLVAIGKPVLRGFFPIYRFISLYLLLFISFTVIYEFADRNIKKFSLARKDIIFVAVLTIFASLLFKACLLIFENYAPDLAANLLYLVPLFSFGIIMRIVLFSEAVIVFSIMLGFVVGFILEGQIGGALFFFLGNVLASYFSGRCENRNQVLKAGLYTGLIMSLTLILYTYYAGSNLSNLPLQVGLVILGGIGSSFVALGLLPVVEHVFDYTTDIRLLELANLEHTLLKELMINAPGTYHHSIVIGNLSKAAAEAIGANPLLARVAAYYHDIGKMKMPYYFIENRTGFDDAHKSLTPNMSALIIHSHVKEGVDLAERYRLGRKLREIIRQHHGTSLVSYFFNRAKELEDPELHVVEEKEYRYAGPKPQTKEAGIVMLADAVEASSRTLEDPTPKRIENHIRTIIERFFVDGQLDECELTLKDLNGIQKSFNTIMMGMFHQRIEYPERPQQNGSDTKFPKTV